MAGTMPFPVPAYIHPQGVPCTEMSAYAECAREVEGRRAPAGQGAGSASAR